MVLFYIISADLSTIIYHFLLFILIFAIFIHFIVVCLPHPGQNLFSLCAPGTRLKSGKHSVTDWKKHRIRLTSKCPPHTVPAYKLIFVVCLTRFFILHRAILVSLDIRYTRKVKLAFIVSTISRWRIKASAPQCSTGALLRMLRHGGSQTCAVEGVYAPRTSRQERRGVLEYRIIRNSFKNFLRSPAPDPRTGSDKTDDTYRGQR